MQTRTECHQIGNAVSQTYRKSVRIRSSVANPKFAIPRGNSASEFRIQSHTSNLLILVWFSNLKFLNADAIVILGTSNSPHWPMPRAWGVLPLLCAKRARKGKRQYYSSPCCASSRQCQDSRLAVLRTEILYLGICCARCPRRHRAFCEMKSSSYVFKNEVSQMNLRCSAIVRRAAIVI